MRTVDDDGEDDDLDGQEVLELGISFQNFRNDFNDLLSFVNPLLDQFLADAQSYFDSTSTDLDDWDKLRDLDPLPSVPEALPSSRVVSLGAFRRRAERATLKADPYLAEAQGETEKEAPPPPPTEVPALRVFIAAIDDWLSRQSEFIYDVTSGENVKLDQLVLDLKRLKFCLEPEDESPGAAPKNDPPKDRSMANFYSHVREGLDEGLFQSQVNVLLPKLEQMVKFLEWKTPIHSK